MNSIEQYVNQLYENQNIGADYTQKNLCSKAEYEQLCNEVLGVIKANPDGTLEEWRQTLFTNSGLEELLRKFVFQKQEVPGVLLSYGTDKFQETIIAGNKEEVVKSGSSFQQKEIPLKEDSIFDLASTTKLFTALSILKLIEFGWVDLDDDVTLFLPELSQLKGISIFDLLTYIPLETNGRIDKAGSIDEAKSILFSAKPKKLQIGQSPYNDIAPMILKYVIEKVADCDYYSFIENVLLKDVNMPDTLVAIPEKKIERVVSTNFDGRIYKDGNYVIRDVAPLGVSCDEKAKISGQPDGILSGHAGLFSTAQDMTTLAKALTDGKVIPEWLRNAMAMNRTGEPYIDAQGNEKFIQHFGMLCYSKNPVLSNSEVHHLLSGRSFAAEGWTGTQFTVDPINKINFFLGSNRSHHRMTVIDSAWRDKIKTDEHGKRSFVLPNGYEMIDATSFAMDRDAFVHPAIKLALKYKILEDITLTQEKQIAPSNKVLTLKK